MFRGLPDYALNDTKAPQTEFTLNFCLLFSQTSTSKYVNIITSDYMTSKASIRILFIIHMYSMDYTYYVLPTGMNYFNCFGSFVNVVIQKNQLLCSLTFSPHIRVWSGYHILLWD